MPALADPVHHPGRVVTRRVAPRLAELQPRGVRTRAGRLQAGGARGNDATVDGHLQLLARRVEARDEEGNVECEPLAQPPAEATGRTSRTRFADLLIAATAAAHGLPLYTRNPGDFIGLDEIVRVVGV